MFGQDGGGRRRPPQQKRDPLGCREVRAPDGDSPFLVVGPTFEIQITPARLQRADFPRPCPLESDLESLGEA